MRPPDFLPERSPALNFAYRRFPAALRVLGYNTIERLEPLPESEIYAAVRYWMRVEVRKTLKRQPEMPSEADKLRNWLGLTQNPGVASWWKNHYAWRSPREFPGYRKITGHNGIQQTEPYEIANYRLPDDVSTDADVVCFQAWCQGVRQTFLKVGNPLREGWSTAIRAGLVKYSRSPWVCFAMAAPYMQPTGVLFPSHGYIDSCTRLHYLLKHPYEATQGELRYILASEMFKKGRGTRMKTRRRQAVAEPLLPAGNWYVGGSIRHALGPDFRRGAEWTGYIDGKRLRDGFE